MVDLQGWPAVGQVKFGSNWHVPLQPSPFVVFLSSHCSPRSMFTTPSPQNSFCVHSMPGVTHENPGSILHAVQPSLLTLLPSSHASPASSTALPHTLFGAATHLPAPVVGSFEHVKPARTCLQSAEQPPLTPPSSQASCGSTLPFPQTQIFVHVSPVTVAPASAAGTEQR